MICDDCVLLHSIFFHKQVSVDGVYEGLLVAGNMSLHLVWD